MQSSCISSLIFSLILIFYTHVQAQNSTESYSQDQSQSQSQQRYVFAHFVVGITGDRTSTQDWDADMVRAKAAGIDAFALDIGTDAYTDTQLGYAYDSAQRNGMKVFLSFDFNYWSTTQPDTVTAARAVGTKIAQWAEHPAQLRIFDRGYDEDQYGSSHGVQGPEEPGKVFVSSFVGDGLDVASMRQAAADAGLVGGLFFAPNFRAATLDNTTVAAPAAYHSPRSYQTGTTGYVDGALNWMAWLSNGLNRAPDVTVTQSVDPVSGDVKENVTVQGNVVTVGMGDAEYIKRVGKEGYVAPVSPWFFTHYGPEVPYSKNWLFPSDLLWYYRWKELLALKPRFVEIVSWNDYGESHYVGPLSSKHYDDGASKWVNDMPHDAWLEMAKPFIRAFKAGSTSLTNYLTEDQLFYWYRPAPKGVNCNATDTCMSPANNDTGQYYIGPPNGWQSVQDNIFVVTFLKEAATILVTSGEYSKVFRVSAGATALKIPMGIGKQSFTVSRGSKIVLSGTSLRDVLDECPCGLYNFNAYAGMLPAQGDIGSLHGDGLASYTKGLRVSTCIATPSLRMTTSELPRLGTVASSAAASFVPLKSLSASRLVGRANWHRTSPIMIPAVTERPTQTIDSRSVCVVTVFVTTTVT